MNKKSAKPSITNRKAYRDITGIKRFGERIREIRKEKNLTQEELVRLTGFDLRQIGRIERGEVSTNISNVFKIAECLNVAVHELFMFSPPTKESKKGK